jgi:hypothetical protein
VTDSDPADTPTVGYKRTPLHSRFPPGQSGNPKGKKKGLRAFATDAKAVLEAPVVLNDKGKTRRVSTQEAALLRLKEKALKGDARALDRLLQLAQIFNVDRAEPTINQELAAEDREILDAYAAARRVDNPNASEAKKGLLPARETEDDSDE